MLNYSCAGHPKNYPLLWLLTLFLSYFIIIKAFIETMHSSRPGMNESDLYAKLEYVSRKEGAQMLAFPPVVAGGNRYE